MNTQFFDILNSINPDTNFIESETDLKCQYKFFHDFSDISDDAHCFTVACFNIRSFFKHIDEFLSLINCNNNSSSFDVIILTETWLNKDVVDLANIPGYDGYHCYRSSNKAGGVSIFVRNALISESIDVNLSNNVIECLGIRLRNLANSEWTNILGLYRPPSGNLSQFISLLEEILSQSKFNSSNSIISGDFNVCLLREETSKPTSDLINLMHSFYFYSHIDKPTRVTDNSNSLIDHIWSNFPFGVSSNIIVSDITDHYPIYACFNNFRKNDNDLVKIKFRDFSEPNKNKLISEASLIDWLDVLGDPGDPDLLTNNFLNKFQDLYDRNFPIKTKYISKKRMNKPWLTLSLIKSIRLKHLKYKQYKLGFLSKNSYNQYKNTLEKLIKSGKKLYYENIFKSSINNVRKSWKLINNILKPNNKSKNEVKLKIDDDYIKVENAPNVFNDYFSTIGQKLKDKVPPCDNNFSCFLPPSLESSIFLTPTNRNEVFNVINSLKLNKGNLKNPTSKIYKLINNSVSDPISIIFNGIISSNIYPDCLKKACVTPLFKSGDKEDVTNYRPISCLPILNTIIEKLLHKRFVSFIDSNNILYKKQYGFRSGMSAVDAISELSGGIYNAMNFEQYFGAVSMDLSKAFDTVNHSVLLDKLHHYGFRGPVHNLLTSYLNNRLQYVAVNGYVSELKTINVGVPQGSVLGPLLFLLYINDMPSAVKESSVLIYADDTTLCFSHKNIYNLCEILSNELASLDCWLRCNFLTLNLNKTNYTIFALKRIPDDIKISINKNEISRLPVLNFLGILSDQKLTFKDHINLVVSKLSKTQGIMYKLNYLPSQILRTLYMTLFQSYLIYCVEVRVCSYTTTLQPLIVLQKKVIRLVNGSGYYDHTTPIFKDLNILKFNDLFLYFICIYSFKMFNNLKCNAEDFILAVDNIQNVHSHNLRGNSLDLPKVNKYKFRQSIFYQVILNWNKFPQNLKQVGSLSVFKRKLKLSFFNQC